MNQSTNSLEDKLKARLHEYEAPPPPGAGGAILDQVNGGYGGSPWGITLALLLGILLIGGGFYMTSTETDDVLATANNAEARQSAVNQASIAQASLALTTEDETSARVSTKSDSKTRADQTEEDIEQNTLTSQKTIVNTVEAPVTNEAQLPSAVASDVSDEEALNREVSAIADEDRTLTETLVGLVSNNEQVEGLLEFDLLHSKEFDFSSLRSTSDELTIISYEPRLVVQPARQKRYQLYGDMGVFFLYNHLQPNKNDGLIMENFETSGSFSLDRLSYYAEFGLKREISKKATLRAAAATNIFSQKYSFDIRDETSTSVVTSDSDDNLLTPVFDRQTVQMDHFLISVGARVSADLKVFNNDLNRLMAGLGYHRILNPEHTFEYKGETQRIEYPHQLTASFGFRKVVWQSDRGELSLLPVLRYGLIHRASESSALTIKPFSVGLTIGYGLK
ncbi:MAG: hypothetical protein RIF33_13390 [Cyclobacteriaceae bacterium]